MKDVRVVIGANFGDEGKGLMTDYFCENLGGKVLNVRFNGTSQAGHTVFRDGKRHVFSHFGSGTLIGSIATYLSSDFYFNPVSFCEEYEELLKIGANPVVYVCDESEAITIFDIFYNCVVEEARGRARHGSCGAGLWEAVNRNMSGYHFQAGDIAKGRDYIKAFLYSVRDEYYPKRFEQLGITFGPENEWYDIWNSEIAIENYIDLLYQMNDVIEIVNEKEILNQWDKQVYEGAQGLLLDYDNREYMPNLTASYTGSKNVVKLLNKIDDEVDIEICYVTRTYFTRHGAGRFETETAKDNLDPRLMEETNVTNRWQGDFRWGYFDAPLFIKTVLKDNKWLDDCKFKDIRKALSFTHANCTDERLLVPEGKIGINDLVNMMPKEYQKYYCCMGKTAGEVRVCH